MKPKIRIQEDAQRLSRRWRDDADSRLDMVRGNLRNLRDILRIGFEHRFGGRLK